jgi:hypothetical protein
MNNDGITSFFKCLLGCPEDYSDGVGDGSLLPCRLPGSSGPYGCAMDGIRPRRSGRSATVCAGPWPFVLARDGARQSTPAWIAVQWFCTVGSRLASWRENSPTFSAPPHWYRGSFSPAMMLNRSGRLPSSHTRGPLGNIQFN